MKVQVFSHAVIPPMSEDTLKVRTSSFRLLTITQHEGGARKQSVLSTNRLVEVISDQPFTILVSNFTDAPCRLAKHMIVARAEPLPNHYTLLLETVCTKARNDAVVLVQLD